MRFLALYYLLGGLVCFFFPTQVAFVLNLVPSLLFIFEAIPGVTDPFWLVLGCSYLLTRGLIALMASFNPDSKGYPWILVFSQVITITGFLYLFIYVERFFAYLLGTGLELVLLVMILWSLVKLVFKGKSIEEHPSEIHEEVTKTDFVSGIMPTPEKTDLEKTDPKIDKIEDVTLDDVDEEDILVKDEDTSVTQVAPPPVIDKEPDKNS